MDSKIIDPSNVVLRPQDRERIIQLLDFCFRGAVDIFAYGSRVKGTSWEASDLDLVVISDRPLAEVKREIHHFKLNFEESHVPILVNIFHWDAIPQYYQEEINTHKTLFFQKREK